MRILQLISSLEFGGVEKYAIQFHNTALTHKGFESFLISLRPGPLRDILDSQNSLIINKKGPVWRLITAKKFIKKNSIDIVHAHNDSISYAVILKILTGSKLIFHNHHGNMGIRKASKYRWLKLLSIFFDFVITVNERLAQYSRDYLLINESKIQFIPNFVVIQQVTSKPVLPGLKKNRVVNLANLNPVKDHKTLIKAFKSVVEEKPDAMLILIGDTINSSYKNELTNLVEVSRLNENVHFMGYLINPHDYLAQCSIGVLSSRMEAFPLTLLEYSVAHLAVITTNVGQCSSLLDNGTLGILVTPGNIKELADSIKHLLLDSELRDKLADSFNKRVEIEYSTENVLAQVEGIYKAFV